jgi:uncharacterized peroxidase-related enzyme
VLVRALVRDPQRAPLAPRLRTLVDYAIKLTRSPAEITEADLRGLRSAGLSDAAIHDAACVVAYFNFVNRTALGLGVELEERDR